MDYSELIKRCREYEAESIVRARAMAAVILSRMGPRLEKRAVDKFQDLAWAFSKELDKIDSMTEFDDYHARFMEAVINEIRNKDGKRVFYGEAQKPINVFFKNYVDRSSLPSTTTAARLRPFLHVPLDGRMIKHFRKNFREDYEKFISPVHDKLNEEIQRVRPEAGRIPDRYLSKLMYISSDIYFAWQSWFRYIYPEKPVLLDTIWTLEREEEVEG